MPLIRPGGRHDGFDDFPWSEEAAKGAVRFQAGTVFDPEGERRLITHFLHERNSQVRPQFIAAREREGILVCDACGVDLAGRYGSGFSKVFEVHHTIRVSLGRQETRMQDLALLCPTCHRVAHYQMAEPRRPEDIKRLVNRQRR
ncbi:HNH endonuclease [Anaeromyxobacter paludicola]